MDPETKQISFQRSGRLGGFGAIKLFDLNGGLVCKKYLTNDVRDGMWQYVQEICKYDRPEQGKARKSTKRIKHESDGVILMTAIEA